MNIPNDWLEHCPRPRPKPAGIKWDVFISYRSTDLVWALSLYDMLEQAGYTIFLDRYVLPAGSQIHRLLADNLRKSASGVIVWSERAIDAAWVEREIGGMVARKDETRNSPFPFHFLAAKLDHAPLDALLEANRYIDFSAYPDGPMGAEIVDLASGLQGAAPDRAALARIVSFEAAVREEPSKLRGMVDARQFDAIRARALENTAPYTTSATLPALAAQCLISGKEYDAALTVLARAKERFPRSIRLRQLEGLALRRAGRTIDAIFEMAKLRADGHEDPETLGILAAAWTDSWLGSKNRDELEKARDLYAQAFERMPTNTYAGINAASKSAMLGEQDLARELATKVLSLLKEQADTRGGKPAADYWERVTEPEALFLLGDFDKALCLYHKARIEHLTEIGSIKSTAAQLALLLPLPFVPASIREAFQKEFAEFMTPTK